MRPEAEVELAYRALHKKSDCYVIPEGRLNTFRKHYEKVLRKAGRGEWSVISDLHVTKRYAIETGKAMGVIPSAPQPTPVDHEQELEDWKEEQKWDRAHGRRSRFDPPWKRPKGRPPGYGRFKKGSPGTKWAGRIGGLRSTRETKAKAGRSRSEWKRRAALRNLAIANLKRTHARRGGRPKGSKDRRPRKRRTP